MEISTRKLDRMSTFLRQLHTLPLAWLHLTWSKRLLIVTLSYWVGIAGLWLLFPLTHNGSSMFIPIISTCWLFRYRGLLISMVLNGIAFQLTYLLFLRGLLPDQAFIEGGIIGFGTSLGLGLMICWLRTAIDLVFTARQQALEAEHERLLAHQAERHATLAYEHQRRINEIKDQFLMNVSHELRTPLTVLGGYLEMFQEFFEQLDTAQRTQILSQARASHQELVSLVNTVLEAMTITSAFPSVHCEDIIVRQAIQEGLAQLNMSEMQAYTIHLKVPEQLHAWADAHYLWRVLHNLLGNIIKYVPTQTSILIEAIQPSPSSPIYLSVQDSGPGIPPEELPFLFEKLTRLKRDVAGTTRGTGLGLYICKYLVEAMGGRIWAESSGRPGEGSRFCITLRPPMQPE